MSKLNMTSIILENSKSVDLYDFLFDIYATLHHYIPLSYVTHFMTSRTK